MTDGKTIRSFRERDHERVDQLLARAGRDPESIDMGSFGEFRRGLLKHIGLEERILLPAMQTVSRRRITRHRSEASSPQMDHWEDC